MGNQVSNDDCPIWFGLVLHEASAIIMSLIAVAMVIATCMLGAQHCPCTPVHVTVCSIKSGRCPLI